MMNQHAYKAALEWYIDQDLTELWEDQPVDRFQGAPQEQNAGPDISAPQSAQNVAALSSQTNEKPLETTNILGAADARAEAVKLANQAQSLDELKEAIANFEGIALKKTATNMVFADGNPKAHVMVIGEAPGADDDRSGLPFSGSIGAFFDLMFSCIGLSRRSEEPESALYTTNILNWRPPGNRTPAPGELDASLPFIERHIQLVDPQIVIFCGGIAAKTLLGKTEGISRLRKSWHAYSPLCEELRSGSNTRAAIATFHPAYLLRTPIQKRAAWADLLTVQNKLSDSRLS